MGTQDKRRKPDIGIIASGYTLDMMGKTQKLELRSWVAEYRVKETIDFAWEMNTWYTMKLDVQLENGQALVRGKVWPRGSAEPAEWTISVTDQYPVQEGAPGLVGVSYAELFYDNIKVMPR